MVAPINTVKHYVHRTNLVRATGVQLNQTLVDAVTVAAEGANAFEVTEGSLVKAIHMDYWVLNGGATNTVTQFTAILEKAQQNQVGATAAELANLGAYDNKRNILWSFQGNLGAAIDGQASVPFIQGWFKIPKGKQRFALGDKLFLSLVSVGESIDICGLSTYKEYK